MRVAITFLAMTLLICPIAYASQIMVYTSEISDQEVDWSELFQIQQFDPGLGDLVSASVTIKAGYFGLVTIINNDDVEGEYSWLTTFDMDLELPDAALFSTFNILSDAHFETGWILPGETKEFPVSQYVYDVPILVGEPLETFIGTGTIDIPVWTDTFSHLQIYFLNGSIEFSATAGAILTVTYIYDGEVPTGIGTWSEVKALY